MVVFAAWVVAPVAFSVRVPPSRLTFCRLLIAPGEFSVRPRAPTVDVTLAPALKVMSLDAFNVSVVAAPAVLAMALATVMLPNWPLVPALALVTVTEVPAFSAVWMLAVVTIALSLLDTKLGLALTLVSLPPLWIVTLFGSSNHWPATPRGAAASASPVACRLSLLLVSMNPPSPPLAPPRADSVPAKPVYSSDQTMILPPWPLSVASACTVTCDPTTVRAAFWTVALPPI